MKLGKLWPFSSGSAQPPRNQPPVLVLDLGSWASPHQSLQQQDKLQQALGALSLLGLQLLVSVQVEGFLGPDEPHICVKLVVQHGLVHIWEGKPSHRLGISSACAGEDRTRKASVCKKTPKKPHASGLAPSFWLPSSTPWHSWSSPRQISQRNCCKQHVDAHASYAGQAVLPFLMLLVPLKPGFVHAKRAAVV